MKRRANAGKRTGRAASTGNEAGSGSLSCSSPAEEAGQAQDRACLEGELALLRKCEDWLWDRIRTEGAQGNDTKLIQALVLVVRAIASTERVRIMVRGNDGGLDRSIRKAVGELDPFKQL